MKIRSSIKSWLMPTLSCVVLAMTPQSRAAVTATFEQVNADVYVTWSGTLDFGASWSHDEWLGAPTSGYTWADDSNLYASVHGAEVESYAGVSETISFNYSYTVGSLGPGDWGYGIKNNNFIIRGSDDDTAPLTSVFTFPAGTHFILGATTLAALGADSFDNTLAWTSATGDTVSYTTILVPEPSSTALFGIGSLALLIRRKR